MNISLSLLMGLRLSFKRKYSSGMSTFMAIIAIISIMLGVIALIVGISAMNGFERELNNRIISVVPQGEIKPIDYFFYNWHSIITQVEHFPGIKAAAPYIEFTCLIKSKKEINIIQVKGIDPQEELRISSLPYFVKGCSWSDFTSKKNQILIGEGLARILKVHRGDWIHIIIPKPQYTKDVKNFNQNKKLLKPKYIHLQIVGLIKLNGILDYRLAFIPIVDAQNYLKIDNKITGIALKMIDPFKARKIVHEISNFMNNITIHSWIDTYGYMYHDIQMIRTIMYLSMILVIGIACFNIISMLIIVVKDKSNDIAIMRTLGAKNSLISAIFIWYGFLISMLASISGALIGILISLNLTKITSRLEYLIGHQLLQGNIYFIDFLPSELHWLDIVYIMTIAIILSLIASWYPARRACYIDPVNILQKRS